MAIQLIRRSAKSPAVARLVRRCLRDNVLASFATVDVRGRAHIHTAYFAWAPNWSLYYYSYPDSKHSQNLQRNPSMAVAVFDSHQTWGREDRGLQLIGVASEGRGPVAVEARHRYASRFPGFAEWVRAETAETGSFEPRPYRFRARRAKLFDEPALGSGVFAEIRLP